MSLQLSDSLKAGGAIAVAHQCVVFFLSFSTPLPATSRAPARILPSVGDRVPRPHLRKQLPTGLLPCYPATLCPLLKAKGKLVQKA